MFYKTTRVVVKPGQKELLDYCEKHTKAAKLFKNAVTYRCRQLYFAFLKEYTDLNDAQNEVLDEFKQIGITFQSAKIHFCQDIRLLMICSKRQKIQITIMNCQCSLANI